MADYTLRIHQLSGALLGEVTLPSTALVRDILTAFAQEPQRLLVKRKLMYQGKILAETDVLHTLFSKGEVGEVIDLHLLQQSLQVQILRDEGSETSRDSMRLNVALCGPPQSGKSSILKGLVSNTIGHAGGVDFKGINLLVDDVPYRILLWDMVIPGCWFRVSFVQGKDAVLLVIDITSPEPFSRLDPWCQQIEDASILTKVMIGNKLDLEGERQISYEDAQRFAAERGFHYLEASAKNGTNVQGALGFAVMDVRANREKGHEPPPEHEMLEQGRGRCAVQWWWGLGPPRARRGFGLVLDLSLMVASACESPTKSGCMVLQERQRPFEDLIYLMKTFNFHALAHSVSVWMLQACVQFNYCEPSRILAQID